MQPLYWNLERLLELRSLLKEMSRLDPSTGEYVIESTEGLVDRVLREFSKTHPEITKNRVINAITQLGRIGIIEKGTPGGSKDMKRRRRFYPDKKLTQKTLNEYRKRMRLQGR